MKRTITVFITAFLSIPAIVLIMVACTFLSAFIYNQKIQTFRTNVTNLNYYIQSTYEDQMVRIKNTMSDPTIVDFIKDPGNPELRDQTTRTVFNVLSIEDNVLEIGLVDLNGNILISSNNSVIEPNQSETLVFRKVIETQESFTAMRFFGDIPLLKIGYPIKDNGQLIGVYIRYTPLNYINFFAHNLNEDSESIFILTHEENGVIFESDGQNILVNDANSNETPYSTGIRELYNVLNSGESIEGSANFNINDENIIGYYQVIEDLNWICMISQPRAIVLYDLNMFQLIALLVTFVFIVFLSIASRKFLGRYTGILEDFSKKIGLFLKGNHDERVGPVEQPQILVNLSNKINDSFDKIIELERTNKEVKEQLDTLLTVDPITKLRNNKALYQEIDNKFGQSPNQLLIMFNTGAYDKLNENFGNSVTNRLLEIIATIISEVGDDHYYAARLTQDSFCIFVDDFDDITNVNDTLNEIRLKISAITKVDDLEVDLHPNIVAVFRDDHLLGRSDWLRLATEVLAENEDKKGSFTIFDFTSVNEIIHEDPQFMDNILFTNNNALEGFSRRIKNED